MANSAPTINGKRKNVVSNEEMALSEIVSASDADGDDIQRFQVKVFGGGQGGFLYLGSDRLANNRTYNLTAEQFSQLTFRAQLRGKRQYETRFQVRASDGTDYGAWGNAFFTTLKNANRPVIRSLSKVLVDADTVTNAGDLFSYFDEDNNTAKIYRFNDLTEGNGYFTLNGRKKTGQFQLTADRLDEVQWVTTEEPTLDLIQVRVRDGRFWSANRNIRIQGIGTPEVATGHNLVLNEQERVSIPRIFRKGDTGPRHTKYQVIDATSGFTSAAFMDGLDRLAPNTIHELSPAELNQLKFEGGKFEVRSKDDIFVRAYNGNRWGKWTNMTVHTEPNMVDALAATSWLEYEPSRDPLVLTYSFLNTLPAFYEGEQEENEFSPLTNSLRASARAALREFERVINVRFVEVPDSNLGTITFGMADLDDTALAWAYFPNPPETFAPGVPGDIWYNWWDFPAFWLDPNNGPGSAPFETTLHELGHAMGEKHPFDGSPVLPGSSDHSGNTVMSYSPHADNPFGLSARTLQIYDIAALQDMYGANTAFAGGDDVYVYGRDEQILDAIWDTGGEDLIDMSNQAVAADIDLRQGYSSSVSRHRFFGNLVRSQNNLTVAYGVEIEHAIGTSFNDTLTGNELDNRLEGGDGRDVLRGRQGDDYLIGGRHSDTYVYQIADGNDTIDDQQGGVDELQVHWVEAINFENLAFRRNGNDLHIDLTIDGAGETSQGTINIKRSVGSGRIESLQLYQGGFASGRKVDLTSVFANAKSHAQNFEITDVLGTYGYLAAPIA